MIFARILIRKTKVPRNTFILKALLKPLAKKPPKGAIIEANKPRHKACHWTGRIDISFQGNCTRQHRVCGITGYDYSQIFKVYRLISHDYSPIIFYKHGILEFLEFGLRTWHYFGHISSRRETFNKNKHFNIRWLVNFGFQVRMNGSNINLFTFMIKLIKSMIGSIEVESLIELPESIPNCSWANPHPSLAWLVSQSICFFKLFSLLNQIWCSCCLRYSTRVLDK